MTRTCKVCERMTREIDRLTELANKRWRETNAMQAALERVMIAGNHIATYRTYRWPDYKPDGLTREQHCERALRTLGDGREYDMWCCWSGIMQARAALQKDGEKE